MENMKKILLLHIADTRKHQSNFSNLGEIYLDNDEICIAHLNKKIEVLSQSTNRKDIIKRLILEEELAEIKARLIDKQNTICEYFSNKEGENDES